MESVLSPPPLSVSVCQAPVGPGDDSALDWFLTTRERGKVERPQDTPLSTSELWQSNLALGLGGSWGPVLGIRGYFLYI